jgi:hypothetical protein
MGSAFPLVIQGQTTILLLSIKTSSIERKARARKDARMALVEKEPISRISSPESHVAHIAGQK